MRFGTIQKFLIVAIGTFGFLAISWAGPGLIQTAQAKDQVQNQQSQNSDDEYNFNWLDPEKKIYVLQNRRYLKTGRVLLSAMVGPGFSNPYKNTFNIDGRFAYYFNETWGIETFYAYTMNSSNNTLQALQQASPTIPLIREIRGEYGALLHWVPWYAKINVFNKILYFDWYFSGGMGDIHSALNLTTSNNGAANYEMQDFLGLFLGTGHEYSLTQDWIIRLDLTASFYRAQVFGNSGDTSWYSNYNFSFGIGLRL